MSRVLYLSLACVGIGIALWAITRFRAHYDTSVLNWRLKQRKRRSVLADLFYNLISAHRTEGMS